MPRRAPSGTPPSWVGESLKGLGMPPPPSAAPLPGEMAVLRALRELADYYPGKGNDKRMGAYGRRLAIYPSALVVQAIERCAEAYEYYPSLKQILLMLERVLVSERAKMEARGMHRLGAGTRWGTDPWILWVDEEQEVYRRTEEHREVLLQRDGTGDMKQLGTYVPDDLGWWFYIPADKRKEDHPRWNQGPRKAPGLTKAEAMGKLSSTGSSSAA